LRPISRLATKTVLSNGLTQRLLPLLPTHKPLLLLTLRLLLLARTAAVASAAAAAAAAASVPPDLWQRSLWPDAENR
jgi:hypothetical protein